MVLLLLFFLFLGIYVIIVVGNLGLMIFIRLNPQLHFLFNMSFIDLCYSSVVIPQVLINFVSKHDCEEDIGALAQLSLFHFFVNSESFLLSAVVYDQYVAICKPLLYNSIMSSQVCSLLVTGVYVMGFTLAMAHTGCMLRLSFCDSNITNLYVCDIVLPPPSTPILELSCTSTYIEELVVFLAISIDLGVISRSYALIFSTVLCILRKKNTVSRIRS
uniref:Olfactory receptor 8B8-like n=1 Tax=Phascolarctos cinereus TaxID=38626 RepID=A0A6P5LKF7_PHACI|nr:olfactory receptor 8B8-like [Phascolarctos cinereus]